MESVTRRPLYKNLASRSIPISTIKKSNAGLWYDKFFDKWTKDWHLKVYRDGKDGEKKKSESSNPKLEWIKCLDGKELGDSELIEEAINRIVKLIGAKGGCVLVFKTDGRFVTGLGRSHPIENGFAWHPVLGIPYLPGSSVKGMLRAWIESKGDAEKANKLFGSAGNVGSIIVLDALPISSVKVIADVMTPHYHGWTRSDPPGDWRSPTPIPFLVVDQGSSFAFPFFPRRFNDRDELEYVKRELREALETVGAGAKTAVGYGRFSLDEAQTEKLRAKLRDLGHKADSKTESQATPVQAWRAKLESKSEDEILDLVRKNLEGKALTDETERAAFAQAIVEMGLWELWKKGNKRDKKTKTGATKLRERARLVSEVLKQFQKSMPDRSNS